MLCHQCGSPVDASEGSCPNCGAELTVTKRLKLAESRGLRISQELKAVRLDQQIFPPGEEIAGRFVLGEMIGKGPFGEVYRARDKAIDAEVGVKIFAADVLQSPIDEERFLSATRAGRRLNQPNVVRLHDAGVHKSHPYVSMQLLEGLSLRKVLDLRRSKGETFRLEELEPIVAQVTRALQHVSRDFPHGDLKPENIVFLPDLIKVTDSYLLAALPARAIIKRLKENAYFAPELHQESTEPTGQADVYSLGVIIGEMMFGPDYMPGTRGDDRALGAIDALVKRATAFDPAERYPTVEALSEDLATVIDTGALLEPASRPPKPPGPPAVPKSGTVPVPPAPPTSPADEEEVVATVEYNRDLDAKLQDSILTREAARKPKEDEIRTREVGRAPRRAQTRTVTAAIPKPSGPIPAPRPVENEAPRIIVAVVAILVVLAGGVFAMSKSRGGGEVEELGVTPAPKVVSPALVVDEKPAEAQTPSAAATVVDTAQSTAVAAVTNGQPPTPSEPAPSPTPVESTPVNPPAAVDTPPSTTQESGRPATTPKEATGAPAPTTTASSSAKSSGTDCPGGMRLMKSKKLGNVCIDTYEFPGGGVKPRTNVSWFQAKKHCESQGKRLCKRAEWRSACGSTYPYGSSHDADKCNTADADGFERSLAATGSFKDCRSRIGTYDMVGNAHEWVDEQRIAGGGFESDEAVGSCKYSSPKSPASAAGYIGFRCCKNAD